MSEQFVPEEARNFTAPTEALMDESQNLDIQSDSTFMNRLRERAQGLWTTMVLTIGLGVAGRAEAAQPPVDKAAEVVDQNFEGGRVKIIQKHKENAEVDDKIGNETVTKLVLLEDPTPNQPGDEVLTTAKLYHWESGAENEWQTQFESEAESGVVNLFGQVDGVPEWLQEKAQNITQLNLMREQINLSLQNADAMLRTLRGLRHAGKSESHETKFIQNTLKKRCEALRTQYPGIQINAEAEKEIGD